MNDNSSNNSRWHGGVIEASIILGKAAGKRADQLLLSAISKVWENELLDLYSDRNLTNKCPLSLRGSKPLRHSFFLHGTLSHKLFGTIPFCMDTVRELEDDDGDDWLNLGIPLGGLSHNCSAVGGWPFRDHLDNRQWREPIEKTLSDIVLDLATVVPFKMACIGFLMSGMFDEGELSDGVPSKRTVGYVVPQDGDYIYFPTTDWEESRENISFT